MEDGQNHASQSEGPHAANGSPGAVASETGQGSSPRRDGGSNSSPKQGEQPRPLRRQTSTVDNIASNITNLFGSEEHKDMDGGHAPSNEEGAGEHGAGGAEMNEHKESLPNPIQGFSDINLGIGFGGDLYGEAEEARLPSEGGVLELVEWLPTLPQLFIFMALTQMIINFFWFIADCTEDSGSAFQGAGEKWFQVTSWVILIMMLILYLGYMWLVKGKVLYALASTAFALFVFISFFYAPFTSSDSARGYQATFTFFRCIFMFVITALYAVAYREDIVPPRDHLPPTLRNFVVKFRLDQP